jgi:hypothetical protein
VLDTLWHQYLAPLLADGAKTEQTKPLKLWQECQTFLSTELAWRLSQTLFKQASLEQQNQSLAQIAQLIEHLNQPASAHHALRHPFWIDLYVFCLGVSPAQAQIQTVFAQRWQHLSESIPDYKQRFKTPKKPLAWPPSFQLTELLQALAQPQFLSELESQLCGQEIAILDREYLFWNQFFPIYSADAFALHAYYHLAAKLLALYAACQLYQTHLLKPLLVPVLKLLWSDQPSHLTSLNILQQAIASISSWASDDVGLSGYLALSGQLNYLDRQLEDLSKVRQYRNDIFLSLYTGQAEHHAAVLDKINKFIKSSRPIVSSLDTLIRDPEHQRYELLHPPVIGTVKGHVLASFGIKHYVLTEQSQPQQIETLGHKQLRDLAVKAAHQNYAQAMRAFWQSPVQGIFKREGAHQRFESLWVSEGEILLYALLDKLLGLKQDGTQIEPAAIDALLIELGLFQASTPFPIATLKMQALLDACERELCGSRTGHLQPISQARKCLQGLVSLIWERLDADLYTWQRTRLVCERFIQQANLSQAIFRTEICPFPTFLHELPLRLIAPVHLQNSFVHPLIYESDPEQNSFELIPAALMVGTVYGPPLLGQAPSRTLPFIAALHKYQLSPLAHLTRYLVDIQVLEQRQKSRDWAIEKTKESERSKQRAEKLELEREQEKIHRQIQQDRINEYERVKDVLEKIKGLFNQQQSLWDNLDHELQAPEILKYGVHSMRTLNAAFNPDKYSENILNGFHRPGHLDNLEQLGPLLYFMATGQTSDGQQALPSPGQFPNPRSMLGQLYAYWFDADQSLDLARSVFAWLKTQLYDTNTLELGRGQLRLIQILSMLNQLGRELQAEHIPVFFWLKQAEGSLIDLKPLLADDLLLPKLLENKELQTQFTGFDWSGVLSDTKKFKPWVTLAEKQFPIVFMSAFENLILNHLRHAEGQYLQVIRIQAIMDTQLDATGLYLECICKHALSAAQLNQIDQHLNSENQQPRDFSNSLQKLSKTVEQSFSASQVFQYADFYAWLQSENHPGFYLHSYPNPEAPAEMETRIVVSIGNVAHIKKELNQVFTDFISQVEEAI